MERVRVDRIDQERMVTEADRWMLANLFHPSADFCTSLAGSHNNMVLTGKEAGQSLKNAVMHLKGRCTVCTHRRYVLVQMLTVLRRKVRSETEIHSGTYHFLIYCLS